MVWEEVVAQMLALEDVFVKSKIHELFHYVVEYKNTADKCDFYKIILWSLATLKPFCRDGESPKNFRRRQEHPEEFDLNGPLQTKGDPKERFE